MARLVWSHVPGTPPRTHTLGDSTLLGRHPECTLCVLDPQASKHHARIDRRDDAFVVKDLASLNGTFVNGHRLTGEHRLRDGDVLLVGTWRLRFEARANELLPPPPPGRAADGADFVPFDRLASDPSRLRAAYERLRLFHDVARAILPERDPDEALAKLVLGVRSLVEADRAVLLLFGPGGALAPAVTWEREGAGPPVDMTDEALEHCLAGRCTVSIHGTGAARLDATLVESGTRRSKGMRTVFALPVVRDLRVAGVLWLEAERPGDVDVADLQLVASLAPSVAAACETAAPRGPALH